ncbi:MAG: hypothetical protein K5685_13900 [Bacteroidales bacterium]|nr:hypothetical protein [Bacteroidales bacterium]
MNNEPLFTINFEDEATLYGTDTMNEAVKQMIGYGVDTETSFQMSEALSDIAMGDKNKMGSLSMAFSQMAGLGKLQTQDWKQMVGAGFNPFSQMEKDLGNAVNSGKNTSASLAETANNKTEKVASSGTRNTQITITLGNLVGTIAFNGGFE